MYAVYLLGTSHIGIGHHARLLLLDNFKINNINNIKTKKLF